MNPSLERGRLLLAQERTDLAAQEFARALSDDPDDPRAHALLALCLSRQERHAEAVSQAQAAVALAPDYDFAHYVLGVALRDADKLSDAEAAAREAVRLDPENSNSCALLATVLARRGRWADAHDAAERGVQIDPDNTDCANLRAMALVHLGQKQEAGETLRGALAKDPQNALTHANQGWALLHVGRPADALPHFREALRLEPDMEWARQGILEALRARNPVYRVLLRYFLWMSRQSKAARWGVVLGVYVAPRLLNAVTANQPALRPVAIISFVIYGLFVLMTWTARPLTNLLLRLDPFGRLLLSPQQVAASYWVGSTLLAGLLTLLFALAGHNDEATLASGMFLLLLVPVAATCSGSTVTARRVLGTLTSLLGLVFITGGTLFIGERSLAAGITYGLVMLGLVIANIIATVLTYRHAARKSWDG